MSRVHVVVLLLALSALTSDCLLFGGFGRRSAPPTTQRLSLYTDSAPPSTLPALSTSPPLDKQMKLGVLLLNLGGPESMKDVEGFLFNLFADPDIIRLPSFISLLQKPIAYFIAKRRAPKSSEAYQSIGGGWWFFLFLFIYVCVYACLYMLCMWGVCTCVFVCFHVCVYVTRS